MPRLNFTSRSIEALKPPLSGGRIEHWDDSLPGFGVRITPQGRKTWVLMFWFNGRQRRLTLGTHPSLPLADARKKAKDALYRASHGTDPASEKRSERQSETFRELAQEYLDRHAKLKKKSWKEDERILAREFLPGWRHCKANGISRRDVIHLLDRIIDRGAPIQANRALALIRKVFNFGIHRSILEVNPAWHVPAPGEEKRRDRVLTSEEMKKLWDALESHPAPIAGYFKLLLLTAQRPGEVLKMEWTEIDFSAGWWAIPAEKAKNGLPHRVPLTAATIRILRELKLACGSPTWVFPGRGKVGSVQNIKRPLNEIREESTVSFRPHDLRRTAASNMTGVGIPRLTVSKILNHVETSVTAIYDRHSYDREKQDALQRWAEMVFQIVAPTNKSAENLEPPISDNGHENPKERCLMGPPRH